MTEIFGQKREKETKEIMFLFENSLPRY